MGGVCTSNNVSSVINTGLSGARTIQNNGTSGAASSVETVLNSVGLLSLISNGYQLIAAKLPYEWEQTMEEQICNNRAFSQFALFLSKPTPKPIYESELQKLDGLGAIDLQRISREQWPSKDTNYFCLISINTYEQEAYTLGVQPVNDAIEIAKTYKSKGYRVAYLFNSSTKDFIKWTDFFIEKVKKEITVYFSGVATNVIANGEITQILAFRNEDKSVDGKGGGVTQIPAAPGYSQNSVSEDFLEGIVERTAKPELRAVFISNVVNNTSAFTAVPTSPTLTASSRGNAKHKQPPFGTVYAQNNSATKESQHDFVTKFLAQASTGATFTQLKGQFTVQEYAIEPNGGVTIVAHEAAMFEKPAICVIPSEEFELQLEEIGPYLSGEVTALPDVAAITPAEAEAQEQRWVKFCSEMKKSPNYDSIYKDTLVQLDTMGCINLERLNRSQIPNIRLDRVVAMFFNPYEDLEHTLGLGPVNDALTISNLFISKGYKVLYIMDATPKEFYSWMDWIFTNVRGEIVTYYSGHGTQTKDYTGKESDGMSEMYLFYNESKKAAGVKIPAMPGITDNTVTDDVLHKLITLKDYPDTRILLISDCCHSGTMFNFDSKVQAVTAHPPLNVIAIGAAKDEQTAKQTRLGGKMAGVFTHTLDTVVRANGQATFKDLQEYCEKNITKYQDIKITTTNTQLLSKPIITEPIYSSDPKAKNYSPANASEADLAARSKEHKTTLPAENQKPPTKAAVAAAAAKK